MLNKLISISLYTLSPRCFNNNCE